MAIRTIKVCDLCGAEQEKAESWAHEFAKLSISTPCGAGGNMVNFSGLVCQECGVYFLNNWKEFKAKREALKDEG